MSTGSWIACFRVSPFFTYAVGGRLRQLEALGTGRKTIALEGHPIDGSLASWDELAAEFDGRSGLLVGNGLSKDVWDSFGYPSLLGKAPRGDEPGCLSDEDCALFEILETENFERVLAELAAAIEMAEALGVDAERFHERYASIQLALGSAVQSVHAGYHDIPEEVLEAIGRVLQGQSTVFTTNYDLVVYWAMRAVRFAGMCDCFWGEGSTFDPANAEPSSRQTPVYFLHGGLHLAELDSGVTHKFVSGGQNLLVKFAQLLRGEEPGRPLLVTEGEARHKLQAIEENDYLARAFYLLGKFDLPLVVFGSGLGSGDQHLVEALDRNPDRPVAVSIYTEGMNRDDIRAVQGALRMTLKRVNPLLFFDSATHPLGSRVPSADSERRRRRRLYRRR